jgi:hypothetical protein
MSPAFSTGPTWNEKGIHIGVFAAVVWASPDSVGFLFAVFSAPFFFPFLVDPDPSVYKFTGDLQSYF